MNWRNWWQPGWWADPRIGIVLQTLSTLGWVVFIVMLLLWPCR